MIHDLKQIPSPHELLAEAKKRLDYLKWKRAYEGRQAQNHKGKVC
jgi:hypothetical protein